MIHSCIYWFCTISFTERDLCISPGLYFMSLFAPLSTTTVPFLGTPSLKLSKNLPLSRQSPFVSFFDQGPSTVKSWRGRWIKPGRRHILRDHLGSWCKSIRAVKNPSTLGFRQVKHVKLQSCFLPTPEKKIYGGKERENQKKTLYDFMIWPGV